MRRGVDLLDRGRGRARRLPGGAEHDRPRQRLLRRLPRALRAEHGAGRPFFM